MASMTVEELYERYVKPLPDDSQRELLERIASGLEVADDDEGRAKWSTIRGAAPYPLFGEDAQECVPRTRREADERREIQWLGGWARRRIQRSLRLPSE